MKKTLLLAAFVLSAMAASAQSKPTITPSLNEDGEPTFTFSPEKNYYYLYLGDETKATYASEVPEENMHYIGPDDQGRHLYVWNDTFAGANADGVNSFGVPNEYVSFTVGSAGWSGLGYNIQKDTPVDMSQVSSDYTFHIALKSQSEASFLLILIDKAGGHEAKIAIGKEPYVDGGNTYKPIGDISRDGEWNNVDIPLSYLADNYGFAFDTTPNSYGDVNSFSVLAGGTQGTDISWDAVMYYGPNKSTGINNAVTTTTTANAKLYNLAGQQVSKNYKGIVVSKGHKFVQQ